MEREVGRGFRMGSTCTPMADSYQCMAEPLQYCKVISLQLKLKKKKDSLHLWKLASLYSSVKVTMTSENFVGTQLSTKQLTRNEAQDL